MHNKYMPKSHHNEDDVDGSGCRIALVGIILSIGKRESTSYLAAGNLTLVLVLYLEYQHIILPFLPGLVEIM